MKPVHFCTIFFFTQPMSKSTHLMRFIFLLTMPLQGASSLQGEDVLCGEGRSLVTEEKKRAGTEVTEQQQQLSYYNVSMAAGAEQQHITALCSTRMSLDRTQTEHTYTNQHRNHTEMGHFEHIYTNRHRPTICNKHGMFNLLD